jgi:hypothetical protein
MVDFNHLKSTLLKPFVSSQKISTMQNAICKLFIAYLFLLGGGVISAQPANTNISNGLLFDGEPYLAVNPTNNQNLVAAWMGLKLTSGQLKIAIKTRTSFDGGNSWSIVNTLPHFGTGYGSADVSMAFDKSGLLYICYIDYKQSPDSGGVYVARSSDGGLNWDTPTLAIDMYDDPSKLPIDRPWLVVDHSNTSNAGTLYITTKPPSWIPAPNRNYYKVSTDSGFTWTTIRNIDGGNHLVGNLIQAPMAAPATTLNGNFCAIYPSYVTSQNILPAFYFATSNNQGQSFNYTTVFTAVPAANDTNYKNGYQLLANPADSNQLILFIPDAQNGDGDIEALHSNDGGQTWIGPVRVNDDAVGNGKGQDMVWGAYNETGDVVVSWRDRRNASTNGFWNAGYDFYYATSADNGQNFSVNQKLSNQFITFDSVLTQNGNDFMSCVYAGDTLYSVWGDTRDGKMNIYFAKTIAGTNTNISSTILDGGDNHWSLFPNPVLNELTIVSETDPVGKQIFIFDVTAKKVFEMSATGNRTTIPILNLSGGLYFVLYGNEVRQFIKK